MYWALIAFASLSCSLFHNLFSLLLSGPEVKAQELVFTDSVHIAIKINGLVSVLECLIPQFYRFL